MICSSTLTPRAISSVPLLVLLYGIIKIEIHYLRYVYCWTPWWALILIDLYVADSRANDWLNCMDWWVISLWVRLSNHQVYYYHSCRLIFGLWQSSTDEWYEGIAPVPGHVREGKYVDGIWKSGAKLNGSITFPGAQVPSNMKSLFYIFSLTFFPYLLQIELTPIVDTSVLFYKRGDPRTNKTPHMIALSEVVNPVLLSSSYLYWSEIKDLL